MKIGIADPQGRVRFSLRVLLEQQPGWTVTGEAADGEELLFLVQSSSPDLLLMDWNLPGQSPQDFLRQLRSRYPNMLIVILSGKQELRQAALHSGADAFACKAESPEKLLELVHELVEPEARPS